MEKAFFANKGRIKIVADDETGEQVSDTCDCTNEQAHPDGGCGRGEG